MFRYTLSKWKERAWIWIVWRLPKTLIMWATIRLVAHATTGQYDTTIVPELSAMNALKRWHD